MNFKELLGKQMLFFDGATGTQLQARGLQPGELPESWNFTHPDIVEAVHRSYLDVGSNIVKSNTFGANPLKLAGSGLDCKETIEAAVAIAKKACGGRENKFVALNLGPTGKLLAPYGDLPFEKAVAAYGEMVRYGAAAGADLILIETMSDTYEIKAAVLASKENSDLPICVTMTFDEDGKLLTGATVEAAALMCEGLGVDAIGFNCGLGPVQVGKLFPQMLAATSLPLIINPNAGLPVQRDGKTCFDVGPEEYAELMYELAGKGASIVGGCCGTTPEHIAQMIAKCKTLQPGGTRDCRLTAVSSYGKAVHLGEGPIIIGERINPTGKKRLKEALVNSDLDYVCRLGLEQIGVGAQILDVNVGTPGIDEAAMPQRLCRRCRQLPIPHCRLIHLITKQWKERCAFITASRCSIPSTARRTACSMCCRWQKNTALCWLHCVLMTAVFPLLQQDVSLWPKKLSPVRPNTALKAAI